MKSFTITAFFPEVKPAHLAFQSIVAKGSTVELAVKRGLHEIRGRDGIRGKKVHEIRLTVKEINLAAAPEK